MWTQTWFRWSIQKIAFPHAYPLQTHLIFVQLKMKEGNALILITFLLFTNKGIQYVARSLLNKIYEKKMQNYNFFPEIVLEIFQEFPILDSTNFLQDFKD